MSKTTGPLLSISDDLLLPLDAVTQKLAWLGTTGSGKSYGATKTAEEMIAAGAQVVALDPVGIWYGLRTAANGKSAGIAIPVFGGLHGDIPLEATGGALMADLVVDKNMSCVIDVSQFEHDTDKAKFVTAFGKRLFFRKKASPSAMHLFLEEAEEFLPQEPEKEEAKMVHELKRIWKLGRNFGIGGSLISQRPQEINKKALNLSAAVFAFRSDGPHERKAIQEWLKDKDIKDQDIAADLPKLKKGCCHLWSPSWLGISQQIKISQKWTFDSSKTPEVGAAPVTVKMAEINLVEIATQMQATVERAREVDPAYLTKRIKELERKLAVAPKAGPVAPVPKPVIKEISVFKPEDRLVLENVLNELVQAREDGKALDTSIASALAVVRQGIAAALVKPMPLIAPRAVTPPVKARAVEKLRTTPVEIVDTPGTIDPTLHRCEKAILTVLGQYPQGRTHVQLALLAGYSGESGGFKNSLGKLRTLEYITRGPNIQRTPAGDAVATEFDVELPQGQDLVDYWLAKLSKCEGAIFKYLTEIYPQGVEHEDLANAVNYASESGGFKNALGRLRTLELIARGRPIAAIIHAGYGSE